MTYELSYEFRFEGARFNDSTLELRIDGKTELLPAKSASLLRELLLRPRQLLTRAEIFELVWPGDSNASPAMLNTTLARLRSSLGSDLAALIVLVKNQGYIFSADVERVAKKSDAVEAGKWRSGDRLPGLDDFELKEALSVHPDGRQTWRVFDHKNKCQCILKFSFGGESLSSLKREVTVSRFVGEQDLPKALIPVLLAFRIDEPPFYLIFEDKGDDLDRWCRTSDRLANLDDEARMELAKLVADCVAAIHGIGLSHHDLKPANILLLESDAGWQISLTDFGDAKPDFDNLGRMGIERLGYTGGHEQTPSLGTHHYRAPEIESGELADLKSDVFSLGVVIYQILAGDIRKYPDPHWENDIQSGIVADVIRRALTGDRRRRNISSQEVSKTLINLEHLTEVERVEELERERLREEKEEQKRWRARRPAIGAAFLVLLLASGFSWVQARNAQQAQLHAEAEAERANSARRFVQDIITTADPSAPGAPQDATVATALTRAIDALKESYSEDSLDRPELAGLAGDIFSTLDFRAEELNARQFSFEEYQRQLGPTAPRTIRSQILLVRPLINNRQLEDARMTLLEVEEKISALTNPPAGIMLLAEHARLRYHLHTLDFAKASTHIEPALLYLEQADNVSIEQRISIHGDIAHVWEGLDKSDQSIELLENFIDQHRDTLDQSRGRFYATLKLTLGRMYTNTKRFDQAEEHLLELSQDTARIFGATSYIHALVLSELSLLFGKQERWVESLDYREKARGVTCAGDRDGSFTCLQDLGNEATIVMNMGDYEAAIPLLNRTRSGFYAALGQNESNPVVQLLDYNTACARLRAFDEPAANELLDRLDARVLGAISQGEDWDKKLSNLKTGTC